VKAAQHKTAQTRQLHRCTVPSTNGTNANFVCTYCTNIPRRYWTFFCNV